MLAVLPEDQIVFNPLPPWSITVVNRNEGDDAQDLDGFEVENPAHDEENVDSTHNNDDGNDCNDMEYDDDGVDEEENKG